MTKCAKTDIREILDQLDTPVSILDGQQAEYIMQTAPETDKDGIFRKDGKLYLTADDILLCTEDRPGSTDLMKMLKFVSQRTEEANPRTATDALRLLITGRISGDEANETIRRFKLRADNSYRLIVFRIDENRRTENAFNMLSEIFPLEERDAPVRINEREFVLVHECEKDETAEETLEYCLALCDTAESEADIRLTAGISGPVSSPLFFNNAYTQGTDIIAIAKRFNRIGPVWIFEKMLLERFLNEVPMNVYTGLRAHVVTDEVRKLLTGDMLETVNMFFKCDLNLSDTARQMFVHRNTLMYRLDKIQKVTGLDLRKFYDAVVFRIVMELPET